MTEVTASVTRYVERYSERNVTCYTDTDTVTVSQSALRPTNSDGRALPAHLVERARLGAQRNLGEPEPERVPLRAAPPPPAGRRPTDWSEDDLDHLTALRIEAAEAAGFVAQYPKAYRATVRARELAAEAERPGHIAMSLRALRGRSRGVS